MLKTIFIPDKYVKQRYDIYPFLQAASVLSYGEKLTHNFEFINEYYNFACGFICPDIPFCGQTDFY